MVIDIILRLTLITLPCDFYLTSMSSKMFLKVKLGMISFSKVSTEMYGYPVWHSSHESCLAPLNHCNLLRLRFGISQLDWRVFPGFSGSSDSGNLLNRNLHKKDGDIYLPPPAKFSLSFFFFFYRHSMVMGRRRLW